MSSTIGKIFRLTTFGESHGPAVGGVIDGIPSGVEIDFDKINLALRRRKPGSSKFYSQRNEKDIPEFLSGIYNGISLGTPIGFIIRNDDHEPADYNNLKEVLRPSHADYTRPESFKGHKVPKILLSGNEKKISLWREQESVNRTKKLRPDLLDKE